MSSLRVAVEGCGHGTLHAIYASVQKTCEIRGWSGVDLLIIGGDFQAVRNSQDLTCLAVPAKYRHMGDFHEYYSGARQAPYLTLFVGGNHEASNYMWELYYGGWVAPNIYYMGAANVLRVGPLRIAGLSGIWKGYNYRKPHHERLPYDQDDIRSIYHVREIDTRKLLQIRAQVDVGISHDWPRGVEWQGDWTSLFRRKGHLEPDARDGSLGSVAAKYVMDRLRPTHWFSAHLHIKHTAVVHYEPGSSANGEHTAAQSSPVHDGRSAPVGADTTIATTNSEEIELDLNDDDIVSSSNTPTKTPAASTGGVTLNSSTDEIQLDIDDSDDGGLAADADGLEKPTIDVPDDIRALLPPSFSKAAATEPKTRKTPSECPPPPGVTNRTTYFLALDKCLPNRDFLQTLEIEPTSPITTTRSVCLEYDNEWLAITRVFANELVVGDIAASVPPAKSEAEYRALIEQEEAWVDEHIVKSGRLTVPENFAVTAPTYDPAAGQQGHDQPREYSNPQTQAFCELVGITNVFHASDEEIDARMQEGARPRDREPFRHGGRGRGSHRARQGFDGRGRARGGRRGGWQGGGGGRASG